MAAIYLAVLLSGIGGDKTQAGRGGKDFWIVKTTSRGKKLWDATFGGNQFEELFTIQQTADFGYIMGGYSLSGINGDKTDPSRGRYDFWVVKTDLLGRKQWDAAYGGNDDDWLAQIRQTIDGGYILGGWSWSGNSGDKSKPNKGTNDYWIIKTDGHGVRQWDADFGGNSNDYLTSIEQTADGGYVLGGYSSSPVSGNKTQATQGGTDYWVVKTDANGKKQWDADFGGSDFDFMDDIKQTADNGYILGGHSASNASGDKTQDSRGFNDYWIIKTNADGTSCNMPANLTTVNITSEAATLKWDEVSGAASYNINYRIAGSAQDWTNAVTTTNHKQLKNLFPGTPYEWRIRSVCGGGRAATSAWSVKQTFTAAAELQAIQKTMLNQDGYFKVNPNPVLQSATVSFSLSKSSPVTIAIIDAKGRRLKVIADENFSTGIHTISFSRESLTAGMYYVQLKSNAGVLLNKIVIE